MNTCSAKDRGRSRPGDEFGDDSGHEFRGRLPFLIDERLFESRSFAFYRVLTDNGPVYAEASLRSDRDSVRAARLRDRLAPLRDSASGKITDKIPGKITDKITGKITGKITDIHDVAEHDDVVVLLSGRADQTPILGALTQHGSPSKTVVLELARQVAIGLQGLHRQDLVHRALNPLTIWHDGAWKRVCLGGLSFGAHFQATSSLRDARFVQHILPYWSPEQCATATRYVDHRSDFYALGVVLYELLTGLRPFVAEDALELMHAHRAKTPQDPREHNDAISELVARIVMKLLAKTPEDRYRSARGLIRDLETCLSAGFDGDANLHLGTRDAHENLGRFNRLVGREEEAHLIRARFSSFVATRRPRLMTVFGPAGVGKTALLEHVLRDLSSRIRFVATCKFDQYHESGRFEFLGEALRPIVWQVLAEKGREAEARRTRLKVAVGSNGQLMTAVVPELKEILGTPPRPPEVDSDRAENRFIQVAVRFLLALSDRGEPVVVFMDDLQWIDRAGLRFFRNLCLSDSSRSLFLIGAYRDADVGKGHPLAVVLTELREKRVAIDSLRVQPLGGAALTDLVVECMGRTVQDLDKLVGFISERTGGIPLAVGQMLGELSDVGFLYLQDEGGWCWDADRVRSLPLVESAGSLIETRYGRLDETTKQVLGLASHIGRRVSIDVLARACRLSADELLAILRRPVRDGLVILEDQECCFAHDRIQEVAHEELKDEDRGEWLLGAGWALCEGREVPSESPLLFVIADLLNDARLFLASVDAQDRMKIARLNLEASRFAAEGADHGTARRYLRQGLGVLPEDGWKRDRRLSWALHLASADSEHADGEFERAHSLVRALNANKEGRHEEIEAMELQIRLAIAEGQMALAVEIGLEALEVLGFSLPDDQESLQDQDVPTLETVIALPELDDEDVEIALRVFVRLCAPVYVSRPEVMPSLSALMVRLSLEYGLSAMSSVAFGYRGLVLCNSLGNLQAAYEIGRLSIAVADRFSTGLESLTTSYMFNSFFRHLREPFEKTLEPLRTGVERSLELGDVQYACWFGLQHTRYSLWAGRNLSELAESAVPVSELLGASHLDWLNSYHQVTRQWIENLRGNAANPALLKGEFFDESAPCHGDRRSDHRSISAYSSLARLSLRLLFGRPQEAVAIADACAEPDAEAPMAVYHNFIYNDLLARLVVCETGSKCPWEYGSTVVNRFELSKRWARECPVNFGHRHRLAEAERHRIDGDFLPAMKAYDDAIQGARDIRRVNEEAFACERAGLYLAECSRVDWARGYFERALRGYARWGARAKVDSLKRNLRSVLEFSEREARAGTEVIDQLALVRSSRALSQKTTIEELQSHLLDILLQRSGAERCALILSSVGGLRLVARGDAEGIEVLDGQELESTTSLPRSVIESVASRQEATIEEDAIEGHFRDDPVIQSREIRSLLCAPIVGRTGLEGVLYLENNLTSGVFTARELGVLEVLATQFLISRENAVLQEETLELNESLHKEIEEHRESEEQLRQSRKMETLGLLAGGIVHDFNNALVSILGYSELLSDALGPAHPHSRELTEIRRAGERAAALTSKILAFSRTHDLAWSVIDLNDVVRDVASTLRTVLGEAISLTLQLCPERLLVEGDPYDIGELIMNLAVNARDAMPRGGLIVFETALSKQESGPEVVRLSVSDNGIGMDEETQRRVFEPFFTTKEVGKGTGLGLSRAQRTVKQMQGNIVIESELGRGTTIHIRVPLATSRTESGPIKDEEGPTEGRETVLLVEDEELVRDMASECLSRFGYTVLVAASADEALSLVRSGVHIDILLSDVIMPGMSGFALAERIASQRPGIKVLFMSGYTDDVIAPHEGEFEARHILEKPFAPKALGQALRAVLDERQECP